MNLLNLWNTIESYLCPTLKENLGEELSKKEQAFIKTCTLAVLDKHINGLLWRETLQ